MFNNFSPTLSGHLLPILPNPNQRPKGPWILASAWGCIIPESSLPNWVGVGRAQLKARSTCLDLGTFCILGVRNNQSRKSEGPVFPLLIREELELFLQATHSLCFFLLSPVHETHHLWCHQRRRKRQGISKKKWLLFSVPPDFKFKGMHGNLEFVRDQDSGCLSCVLS